MMTIIDNKCIISSSEEKLTLIYTTVAERKTIPTVSVEVID